MTWTDWLLPPVLLVTLILNIVTTRRLRRIIAIQEEAINTQRKTIAMLSSLLNVKMED